MVRANAVNAPTATSIAAGSILATLLKPLGVSTFQIASGGICGTLFRSDFVRAEDSGVPVFSASHCALAIGRANCRVVCGFAQSWFYQLDPKVLQTIRRQFARQLCAEDDRFWQQRQAAAYATLMRVEAARTIEPIGFVKRDRRGWIVLKEYRDYSDEGER